jgi:hypothetical protein
MPRHLVGVGTLVCLALTVAAPVAAQAPAPPPAITPPLPTDFMLGRPKGFVAVDGGFLYANAGSDLYDFVTEQLTIEKKSFNTPIFGGRIGWSITPHLEVAALYERARSQTASEYRDFVDNELLPITQTTRRHEDHLAATLRWSLLPAGRSISRFAWIPRRVTPFVGGGIGAVRYTFQQYGSFVDFQTRRIFTDSFNADGWAPAVHALAGADVRVYRKLYVAGEARYTRSKGTLSEDFVGFEPITLAGFRVGGSLKVVF